MTLISQSSIQKLVRFPITIGREYFLSSLVLILTILLISYSNKRGPLIEVYDYGEHTASIRELSTHLFSPQNPLLALDGSTTLRYTPYIFLLAIVKKFFHLNLFTIINLSSIISLFFLISGIFLWSREYFKDEKLPLYVLVALLFLWGKPFNYSNEYNLRFLTYTLFYPSTVTFNLSFLGFYLILQYARYGKGRYYFFYLILAIFIFLTHPLTASFFLLCSFLITVTEGERRLKHLGLYLFSLFIICVFSLLWPYYHFIDAIIKSTTTDWYYPFRMYLYDTRNIYKMGPALLGLPIIFLFLIKKKYFFISWGFILCSFIYIASYLVNIRLGERYIFFIMFFLHLSLAWYFNTLDLLSFSKIRNTLINLNEKNIHVIFFTIILALSIFYQITKFSFEQAGYLINFKPKPIIHSYKNPLDNYTLVKSDLNEGDIVMSDPLTSWLLPALTGAKIVALYHDNPLVPDNNQRVNDTITFYDTATPLQMRKMIVKKYAITHVLLNFDRMIDNQVNRVNNYYQNFRISEQLIGDLKKIGTIIFEHDNFILFKLGRRFPM